MTEVPLTVDAAWLIKNYNQHDVKILDGTSHLPTDGRDASADFLICHIPKARYFDINVIADTASSQPHSLPPAEIFVQHMQAFGLNDNDHIIVYCDSAHLSAARAWWMLRLFGHARVSLLNGGLQSWISLNGITKSGLPDVVVPGNFSARPAVNANAINMASLRTLVETGVVGQIADARSVGRFAGTDTEPRPGLRSGHIPGSSNIPISSLLQNGALKDKEAIAAAFVTGGIDVTRPVITSCGSGVTACGLALGLAILGNEKTFVYDGSWSEWGASDAPIETYD